MTLADPFTVTTQPKTPVGGQCPVCDYRVATLTSTGLPPHNHRRVRRNEDAGRAEEYDAGWCPGGGHEPEPIPEDES